MMICRYAAAVPVSMPKNVPRQVLPLPSMGFLSRNFLLKSSGVFPPMMTGAGFAMYAGNMNHSACIIARMISFMLSPFFYYSVWCILFSLFICLRFFFNSPTFRVVFFWLSWFFVLLLLFFVFVLRPACF